jgi:hypothetical protein
MSRTEARCAIAPSNPSPDPGITEIHHKSDCHHLPEFISSPLPSLSQPSICYLCIFTSLFHRSQNMLATSTAKKAFLARSVGSTAVRSLSVLSAPSGGVGSSGNYAHAFNNQSQHRLQQQRTLLGFVHAIDKRVYQWAKRQMPPISKTEQIALGCGTIGACFCSVFLPVSWMSLTAATCTIMPAMVEILRL